MTDPNNRLSMGYEPSAEYLREKEGCVKQFEAWPEGDQVQFVELLLSHMCHYQHGQINTYLKPMLQRDFISALPGNICDKKKICNHLPW